MTSPNMKVPCPKRGDFFLVAQDMVLSHRVKFQLIINFFRVSMYFVVFLPDYLFECGSNEKGEYQKKKKKKVFSANISINSGCRLKILAIFHKFLSEEKKCLRSKSFMKSGVSPQKFRKDSSCSRILGR